MGSIGRDNQTMGALDKANILLVDDQPARLLTYETILGDLGENLVRAHSGREALAKLMDHDFAVVLLDIHMPDLDGFEVANLMSAHPRFEKTPVIFVTGVRVTEVDRLKGYGVGAVDYVEVPVVPEILRSKVVVFVELYRKRQELEELNCRLAEAHAQLARDHSALQVKSSSELESLNLTLQDTITELEQANQSLQREIAERARAELALTEADHHKDEFLAMLAHELRNPLGATKNALHAARAIRLANPKIDQLHDIMHRQLGAVTRLVDDLLDISRIARGKIALARKPIELTTVVESAVETVSPLVQERGHVLTVDLPDRNLRVDGDPLRLAQVLGNVLGNAAKYTAPGGRITLTVRQEGTEVAVRVRDTGIGIAADRLPVIFELFVQANPENGAGQGGLGIGLALARRLVQMHGGRISAHSEGNGLGSEFVIHLPLLLETASSSASTHAAVPFAQRV
jgi:signal transduction histidine kinase